MGSYFKNFLNCGGKATPQAVYGPSGMTETLFITRADGDSKGFYP